MNIGTLRLYCDVIRTGSFSMGAREHRISQSAASQAIKQLEDDVGAMLIDRSKRPFMITTEGRLFHDACIEMLERFDMAKAALRPSRESVSGDVRVAVIYSVGLQYMGWYNSQFAARYPKSQVRMSYLHPNAVVEAVVNDRVELGIMSFPTAHRSLEVIPWQFEPMVFVCHPSHHLARRRLVTAKDLANESMVAFEASLAIRKAVDRSLRERGVRMKVAMEFDNIETIKEAIAIEAGVGILPRPAVSREVESGILIAIQLDMPELVRPIGIIHRRQRQLPTAAQKFLEMLQEIGDRDLNPPRSKKR